METNINRIIFLLGDFFLSIGFIIGGFLIKGVLLGMLGMFIVIGFLLLFISLEEIK